VQHDDVWRQLPGGADAVYRCPADALHLFFVSLRTVLADIDVAWRSFGAPMADLAAPGLRADRTAELLRSADLNPSQDLTTWFGWHNGLLRRPSPDSWDMVSMPFYELLSLESAVERTSDLRQLAQSEFDDDAETFWPHSWLWLLSGPGGDCLAVDTATASLAACVRGPSQSSMEAIQYGGFPSLIAWATAFRGYLRSGNVTWNPAGPPGTLGGQWDLRDAPML
jgi:hypothetical protein